MKVWVLDSAGRELDRSHPVIASFSGPMAEPRAWAFIERTLRDTEGRYSLDVDHGDGAVADRLACHLREASAALDAAYGLASQLDDPEPACPRIEAALEAIQGIPKKHDDAAVAHD